MAKPNSDAGQISLGRRTAYALAKPGCAVFSRVLAAILGGYVLTSLIIALLAISLPGTRAEAVLTSMLLSFLIYAGAVMWVFACRSASRAWVGMLLPSLVLGAVLLVYWRWS